METNLKFNSAICTSREQSKRLLALGLRKETADMFHYQWSEGIWGIEARIPYTYNERMIPAWTLHRLIEILDIWYLELNFNEFNNAYDQVISYFEERVKGGFINKNYLKE